MAVSLMPRKRVSLAILAILMGVLIAADVHYALRSSGTRGKFMPESIFDGITAATASKVSIARSDDSELPNPVALEEELTYEQVEDMVRRAVDLTGGFDWLVRPGDRVLLKPDIVDPEPPGVGEITDVRVVKAVARLVHEVTGGDVEIIVGEGSPRPMDYELEYAPSWSAPAWEKLWDVAGFQDLLTDPDLEGVNLRLSNLNGPREDLVEVEVPHGGFSNYSEGQVWIHKDVLNADVFINIPVMKIHNTGITVALKNNIGLYPSTRYGFSKGSGVPQDDNKYRLIHYGDFPRDWVEEEIIDINLVADVDFVVVDAIMCLERSKAARRSNGVVTNQMRRNMILAGSDQVAIDHVATRLMGLNPDDVAHVTLGAKVGLGTKDPNQIEILGSTIEESWVSFRKDPYITSDFGQSNRTWLLSGPFDVGEIEEPMDHEFISNEATVLPRAGVDGWTEPIYFFDDRIDLKSFYNTGTGVETVAYAFTYFDAPVDQEAELWVGSDEATRIYLNGEVVYDYSRRRTYSKDKLVMEKVPVQIRVGENALMVKALHSFSEFDFALNICEPETDPDHDGDRVFGLKFRTESLPSTAVEEQTAALPDGFNLDQNYPNPFNANTVIPFRVPNLSNPAEELRLEIFNLTGQRIRTLVHRSTGPGYYRKVWDGTDQDGRPVASGTYLYRMQVGDQLQMKKMLLLR